jgi:hypothetical protein
VLHSMIIAKDEDGSSQGLWNSKVWVQFLPFCASANSMIKINCVNVPNIEALLIATSSFVMHGFRGWGDGCTFRFFYFWAMFYDLAWEYHITALTVYELTGSLQGGNDDLVACFGESGELANALLYMYTYMLMGWVQSALSLACARTVVVTRSRSLTQSLTPPTLPTHPQELFLSQYIFTLPAFSCSNRIEIF